MRSTTQLADFAARLRSFIRQCVSAPGASRAAMPDFDALALELFALQFEHNAPYREFCKGRHALPDAVGHWADIPAVPTSVFKEWELSCLPATARTAVFHSSGTTGQRPSRHFHSTESLALYEASLLSWFGAHFPMANGKWQMAEEMADGQWQMAEERAKGQLQMAEQRSEAWELAILTPTPEGAPHSSLVHMFETIRRELGAGEKAFLGELDADGAGGWWLELERTIRLLEKVGDAGKPLLVLGTAFSFVHLLDGLAARGLRSALPAGSCALETGGYKGRSRALPQAALHGMISDRLGVPQGHIICEYGMSELSSQAYDCTSVPARNTQHATRSFRFPPWARAQIVSPETGREVGDGETGLIRVFDLANVWSVMAIQTEDLGVRCGGGFALAGRALRAEPRGCSLMAV